MRILLPVMVVVAACAVAPAQPPASRVTWSTETVVATPHLVRGALDTLSGGALFARPASIRATGHTIVVADVGDDRILILDSTGTVRRRVGSRGRGPGELLGVSHVALRASGILVGEAHNGRVSEFAYDGRYIGTDVAGFAAGAISANDTQIFAAARSNMFYASLVTPNANPVEAFRRPAFRQSVANDRWKSLVGHDLLATDSNRTWVFDQVHGVLCSYAGVNSQPQCLNLPAPILQRLQRYRAERVDVLEKAIRMRVEAAPLAKDMIFAGRYLALLVPLPDIPVLLIDPADATLTPVMTIGNPLPDWVRSARSFAWDGNAFWLIGDDGLGRLNLTTLNSIDR